VTFINGTLTVAAQPVNLVTNSGFEQMKLEWTFTGDSGVTPAPHTGNYAAFVNIAIGSVSQAIATVPGDIYAVSFWLSANGYSASGAIITASFGGVTGFSNTYPAGAFSYQQESFTVVAATTNSPFTFSGVMNGGTFFLDDVSVTDLGTPTNGFIVTSQPASESVLPGQSGSFQVGFLGAAPSSYQWYFNQTNVIFNATNSFLVVASVSSTNAGNYNVVITGSSGSLASANATLSVLGVPVFFLVESGSVQFNNGSFSVPISGLTGQGPVIIEASSDLNQWTPVYTNPPGFGTIQFVDTNAENYPYRFYRASAPVPQQ
jgi:hypothetical protein